MSTNTPKAGEAAMLIRELRDMVHSLCLERGSTANCHGLMEDASRWLREDEATGTEQPPTLNQLETGVESSPATGTEQDIPAAIEWPDSEAIDAAWGVIHDASPVGASVATARTALVVAAKASPVIPLADHHRALSEAVQAEHSRWVEKLREWIAAKRERNERAPESYRQRLEGYAMALNGLEALLAEAKATEPSGRSIFEEPACTPYPRPDDVVAKATDAADERRKRSSP
jgi:hypothetical protein